MTSQTRNPSRAVPRKSSPANAPMGALELVAKRSSEARERLGTWADTLAQQAREHPIRTVSVALGVGFVLGGGLFSRLAARIVGTGVRIGLRMAVVPLMAQGLVALGEGLLAPRPPAVEVGDRSSDPHHATKTRRRTHEAQ
jgi:hypothetical protein